MRLCSFQQMVCLSSCNYQQEKKKTSPPYGDVQYIVLLAVF